MSAEKNPQKSKQLKSAAKYAGIAAQMGLTIYLGSILGKWLDQKYQNTSGTYYKVVTLVAVFISMYLVISQVVKDSNKKYD